MSLEGGPSRTRQAIDVIVYALAVTALAGGMSLLVSAVAFADTSGGVVVLTFLLGWLITGYGILRLWPRAIWKSAGTDTDRGVELAEPRVDERTGSSGSREETAFQSAVQELPPLRWYSIPPDQRLPTEVKTLLAGVAVLAVSLGVDFLAHW